MDRHSNRMKLHAPILALFIVACGAEPIAEAPITFTESALVVDDTPQSDTPLECVPPHVPGMLRCDELDARTNPTCKAFQDACSTPSCPADWPVPIARNFNVPRRSGCLNSNAGIPACNVPGKNNEVFIDCCAISLFAITPSCSNDSDCPVPMAECWKAWCNAEGLCGADQVKPFGTPCSLGHCESGHCVP
jgi:hypothetical protein